MSLTVSPEYDPDAWNGLVDRSNTTTPLHRYEALDVVAAHASARLHPLVAYNGQEPVGLFPLFETHTGPFTTLTSPPGFVDTLSLGPATLGLDGMKRRRAERTRRQFVESVLEWCEHRLDPDQIRVRTDPRFQDVRPFQWAGFGATPHYTYVVDLDRDDDDLLAGFSRDARRNVRDAAPDEYEVAVGGRAELQTIVEQVHARHEEQDDPLRIQPSVFYDLHEVLPEGVLRPYVCRVDGEYASGVVTLERGDVLYRWKGGTKTDVDLASSDVLDWHIMREGRERGRRYYDLVGANMPRLCEYKAKFGPELWTYYVLERQEPALSAAVSAQRVARSVAQSVAGRVRRHLE